MRRFIERYAEARSQVMGSLEMHRLHFLAAIARLFGETKAIEVDALLSAAR